MFKRREIEREKLMDIFVYYPKGRRDLVMKKKYELNWGTRSALEDIRQVLMHLRVLTYFELPYAN